MMGASLEMRLSGARQKRIPAREGGPSLVQRATALEAKVVENLTTLNQNRFGLAAAYDERRARCQALQAELGSSCLARCSEGGSQTTNAAALVTLKERLRLLEEQASINQQAIEDRRQVLDVCKANKQQTERKAEELAKVRKSIAEGALAVEGEASQDRCDMIAANASLLQSQAVRDARMAFATRSARPNSAPATQVGLPLPASIWRPRTPLEGTSLSARGCATPVPGRPGLGQSNLCVNDVTCRPDSSLSYGTSTTARPRSATSATGSCATSRGFTSRTSSRPGSSLSMNARLQALTQDSQRNAQILRDNRTTINAVVQFRQEQTALAERLKANTVGGTT
eukprot:TRINITY_DN17772_c0_g1_i1.p1 TRINITY_DN17772_c0_g1~~TRINITY_DN17772_c0_g1_i1.p1  ORF type:complete len:367 (-),score=59.25 TRINITY_DN17772_c0_g1_i1:241-1263(-)